MVRLNGQYSRLFTVFVHPIFTTKKYRHTTFSDYIYDSHVLENGILDVWMAILDDSLRNAT